MDLVNRNFIKYIQKIVQEALQCVTLPHCIVLSYPPTTYLSQYKYNARVGLFNGLVVPFRSDLVVRQLFRSVLIGCPNVQFNTI